MLQHSYAGVRPSDVHPTQSLTHAPIFAGADAATGVTVDMRQLLPLYMDDQIGDQCVGEASAAANFGASGCQGQRASHRGVYVGARVLERSRNTDPIPDVGCQTTDAYGSLIQVGYYPLDVNDTDPSQLNAMDTWGEQGKLQRLPPEYLVALSEGDVAGLDSYLLQSKAGGPWVFATFTIQVDDTYESLSTAGPVWGGPTGTKRGYHRQAVAGKVMYGGVLCYLVWNSWGPGWGDGGFSYIPVPIFQAQAVEVVVHLKGVVL